MQNLFENNKLAARLGTAIAVLLIALTAFQCPSCHLLRMDTNPDTITRPAKVFLPTAADVCNDLIAYEPGPKIVQDCEATLLLLADPESNVRVGALRLMVGPRGLINIYLEYLSADPGLSPGEKVGFRATASILQDMILRMLDKKPLTLLDPQWRKNEPPVKRQPPRKPQPSTSLQAA